MKILSVGDNVIDYYKHLDKKFPGGNAVNVSVYMKQQGALISKYIGVIGNDKEGRLIKNALIKEGVNIEGVRTAEGETGLTLVNINSHGERTFEGWNNGGVQAKLKLNFMQRELNEFKEFDLLHTSLYSYLEKELPTLKEYVDISFDFSTCRDQTYIAQVCKHLKYAFFSGEDLQDDEIEEKLNMAHEQGVKYAVITQGVKGSIASHNGKKYYQESFPVEVVDTLGAGDKYISVFLQYVINDKPIQVAMKEASKQAAQICERYGAF